MQDETAGTVQQAAEAGNPASAARVERMKQANSTSPSCGRELRKKLRYRAWHRGTREMDLLLGRFADAWLERFGKDELAQFEQLLTIADPILYDWLCGRVGVPEQARCPVLERLLDFHRPAAKK